MSEGKEKEITTSVNLTAVPWQMKCQIRGVWFSACGSRTFLQVQRDKLTLRKISCTVPSITKPFNRRNWSRIGYVSATFTRPLEVLLMSFIWLWNTSTHDVDLCYIPHSEQLPSSYQIPTSPQELAKAYKQLQVNKGPAILHLEKNTN